MASTKQARSTDFKTPVCRVSYAYNLFKARAQEEGKPPKFGATLIFPNSTSKAAFEKPITSALIEKWGDTALVKYKNGLIASPFIPGDDKRARNRSTGELNPGMGPDVWFIRVQANADHPPAIRYKSPTIPATEEEVYSGCYGFAVLNAFTWENPKNGDGISFGIQYFQKTLDGERLGGTGPVDPTQWHEQIEDTGAAPASTTAGAGAAGLFG